MFACEYECECVCARAEGMEWVGLGLGTIQSKILQAHHLAYLGPIPPPQTHHLAYLGPTSKRMTSPLGTSSVVHPATHPSCNSVAVNTVQCRSGQCGRHHGQSLFSLQVRLPVFIACIFARCCIYPLTFTLSGTMDTARFASACLAGRGGGKGRLV